MSPFFVTLLYGDASFGRAGNDDDDQHNKLPSQAKSKDFFFFFEHLYSGKVHNTVGDRS